MIADHPANYVAMMLMPLVLLLPLTMAPKERFPFFVILASVIVKLFLVIINIYVYNFYPFDADWSTLEEVALRWAENGQPLLENLKEARGRTFFSWLLSIHFRLVGEALFFIFLFNVFLNTLVAIFAYRIAWLLLENRKAANLVLVIVAFFPTYLVYSIGPSREPLVTFGFMMSLYYFVMWWEGRKASHLVWTIVGLLISLSIHSAFAILMLGLIVLIMATSSRDFFLRRGKNAPVFIFALAGFMVVVPLVLVSGWGLGKIGGDVSNLTNVETLERIGSKRDGDARTGYMPRDQVEVNSFSDFVSQLPKRILYYTLKPFPWEIRTPADIIGFVLVIFYVAFFYSIFKMRKHILSNGKLKYSVAAVLLLTFIFALGTSNWGSAARHKSKYGAALVVISTMFLLRREIYGLDEVSESLESDIPHGMAGGVK